MLGLRVSLDRIPWLFWRFEKKQDRFRGRLGDEVAIATKPRPGQLVWQWWEESKFCLLNVIHGLLLFGDFFFFSRDDSVRGVMLARNPAYLFHLKKMDRGGEAPFYL